MLPIAETRLADGAARAEDLRRHGHELSTALHWLDRTVTGDARSARRPANEMYEEVRAATWKYIQAEQALMSPLARVLDGHETVELIRSYDRASLMAPSRGHPLLERTVSGGAG